MHVELLPEHVRQVASHAAQVWPSLSRYWPTGQSNVHVPAVGSKAAPPKQAVQSVALPLEHSPHELSHALQTELASVNLPLGQPDTHAPSSNNGVPVAGQLRQSVLPAPLQERHVASHAMHVATAPTVPENMPVLGHSATHVPLLRNGVLAEVQLTQSELLAPSHVPHAGSHGWQTLLLSEYLPTGRHDARHEPGALKKGKDAAHVAQSIASGPVQVAHDAWHATHVSADDALPSEHVKPASMAQLASHPSKLTRLPSSHASAPTRSPSPQTEEHVSDAVMLPPLHSKPGSTVQLSLQPSPLIVLLSSHSSKLLHGIFMPSPQTG